MSDPSYPQNINLEFLRKQAKALLKRCRAGDTQALSRIRAQLPKLSDAATVKLADVQHALARERGYSNWAALKRHDDPIERFLVAIRGGSLTDAQQELAAFPELVEESIHAACALGDHDSVAHHLTLDAALATAEHNRWPPLLYACASPFNRTNARRQNAGILECVTLLLDAGVDPNTHVLTDPADPESKLTALDRTLMSGNMPVMSLLMQRGAVSDFKGLVGKLQRDQPAMVEGFREYFEMPEARERMERYKAELLEQRKNPSTARDLWPQFVRERMQGIPAFPYRPLLDRGVDPNDHIGLEGWTTFQRLVGSGTIETVELFLKHGADLNKVSPDGRTPLIIAVRAGKHLVADLLRTHGASDAGLRPIDELVGAWIRIDAGEAERMVKSHPAAVGEMTAEDFEVLVQTAALNGVTQANLMLDCGCNPGGIGQSGITALHAAAWHGHLEMVRLLLEFHAPVNIRDKTYGSSPLGWAAHGSKYCRSDDDAYFGIVNALIDAGSDYVSATNRAGSPPESFASPRVAALFDEMRKA
jgi:ankyrin repeat protein